MEPLEETVKYPMENDNWVVTVIIGGILGFLGIFLLPIFIVWGYYIDVMRETRAGNDTPPEFDDWGDLFMEGLKAFIIGFVYMIIPFGIFMVSFILAFIALTADSAGGFFLLFFGGFMAAGVVGLVFSYVAIAGIVNYSREGTIGAGFDIGTLTDVLTEKDYAVAWLVGVGILIAANIVAGIIPIVGFFIGPFVSFYAMTAASRVWSNGFDDALEGGDVTTSAASTADEPADDPAE